MKHYKSVEFLPILRVSSPPALTQRPPQKRKPPTQNFFVMVLIKTKHVDLPNDKRRIRSLN